MKHIFDIVKYLPGARKVDGCFQIKFSAMSITHQLWVCVSEIEILNQITTTLVTHVNIHFFSGLMIKNTWFWEPNKKPILLEGQSLSQETTNLDCQTDNCAPQLKVKAEKNHWSQHNTNSVSPSVFNFSFKVGVEISKSQPIRVQDL